MKEKDLQKLITDTILTVLTKHNQSIDEALKKILKEKGNLDDVEILSYESDEDHITVVRCGNEEQIINTLSLVIVEE